MQTTTIRRQVGRQVRRCGFTLVELLVVIAIIGTLIALLLPAVMSGQAAARKASCLNNMRQVGLGIVNYETTKQRLPGYVQPVKRADGQWVGPSMVGLTDAGFNSVGKANESFVAWSGVILPFTDRQDIWDQLQQASAPAPISKIEVYVCADDTDITTLENAAGLSYVANTGAWDRDSRFTFLSGAGEGDVEANGLFQNLTIGNIKSDFTSCRDGRATTLMLGENVNKDQSNTVNTTWASSWLGCTPAQGGEQQYGMVWVVAYPPDGPPNQACSGVDDQARLGVDPDTVEYPGGLPCYARPKSNHPGGQSNAIMADGSGKSIDFAQMDYLVYQQLMTPWGAKCEDPRQHVGKAVGDNDIIDGFRQAAPLSEDSF